MNRILAIAALMLLHFNLSAQFPGGAPGMQAPPKIGHIYGKIVDSAGKPINEVSVLLLQNVLDTIAKKKKDILLKGFTTRANGEFDFDELPVMGVLKLKISAIGYSTLEQTISFMPPMSGAPNAGAAAPPQGMPGMGSGMPSFDKDLGNIKLATAANTLAGVTVTANKPLMQVDIDKKVFNVEKNMVSAGGTALDVMRNVPSVQVDIEGNVLMRNAQPQIYIDGRPTTLSLDQIPSDAIESVEVITNPSAKFDASGGTAGILNIVLKKNRKTGYNGNLMAGVDKRGGVNGGGNFNIRQGKINLSAALMVNQMRNLMTGTTDRLNYGDTQTHVYQNNVNKTNGGFMFGRLGLDYFLNNRTTLSLSAIRVRGEFKPNETIDITTDTIFSNGFTTSSYSQRLSNSKRIFNATGVQGGMKYNFPKAGEELTADFNLFQGKNTSDAIYNTTYYSKSGLATGEQVQQVTGDGTNRFFTIQTDYVKPLGKQSKLETGLRAQLNKLTSNNNTYIKDPNTGEPVLIPSATNNYTNNDNVYAAYASFKSTIKNFGYQVGLRAESSNYTGTLTNTGETFSNKYPLSLFPSVFLSQKLNNKQELQMSYTRRVKRPNFFQLIPYVDYTDSLNIRKGNPALQPEFTTSLEMSYSKTFKGNNNLMVSLYYKQTDNLITNYIEQDINPITGEEDLINTYVNANSAFNYGSELTSVTAIRKWWDLTANINIYQSKINTDNLDQQAQEAMWSWFGKLNNTFKLPKNWSIQLSADYQSKTNLPVNKNSGMPGPPAMNQAQASAQGYVNPFWGMDAAIKKSFLKNQAATITLSVSDIFGTRKSDQYAYSPYFEQHYYRLNNPQMFRLNLSYRFGKMDASLFKRQNMKSQGEGMSAASQMQ